MVRKWYSPERRKDLEAKIAARYQIEPIGCRCNKESIAQYFLSSQKKTMEQLIEKVISNPLYLTLSVIIMVVLLYAIVKRIVKLLIFLVILMIAFLAYVHYTGSTVKETLEKAKEKGEKVLK